MGWELERDDDVVLVRMQGTKANVQNDEFFGHLHAAFDRLESEFADCAVVLTAEGSAFSAGLDFETVFPMIASAADLEGTGEWIRRYQATNLRIWRHPRPTVAAINGHAFAGGLITALDCDYRVTVEGARFSLNEVPIGIAMPAVYVEIIRYAAGDRSAALTTLFGREYDARAALELGLVHAVTTPERLLDDALEVARSVPPDAFEAYAFSKRALQAPALERIEGAAARADQELPALFSSEASVRVRARRYAEIRGREPSWAPAETRSNVEIVRAIYEGWARGDFSAGEDAFDREIEFTHDYGPDRITARGITTMTDAWRDFLASWDVWRTGEIEELIELEDRIVVFHKIMGRGKFSQADVEVPDAACAFAFRDGKIVWLLATSSRQKALESVGLSPPT